MSTKLTLLVLLAVLRGAVFAACPDPQSSDADNVFALGEPVTLETGAGCMPELYPFTRRVFLDSISPEYLHQERFANSLSGPSTVLDPRLPGDYRIQVSGIACVPPFCPWGSPFLEENQFSVVRTDPSELPTPSVKGPHAPSIAGQSLLFSGQSYATLDNSISELAQYGILNEGEADLVLIDIFEPFSDDIITVYPTNFSPYMTIRPGEGFALNLDATVLDPARIQLYDSRDIGRRLIVRSNDPERPLFLVVPGPIGLYDNASSVPPNQSPVNKPLPSPEPCGDFTDDGILDAADIVKGLLADP